MNELCTDLVELCMIRCATEHFSLIQAKTDASRKSGRQPQKIEEQFNGRNLIISRILKAAGEKKTKLALPDHFCLEVMKTHNFARKILGEPPNIEI